MDRFQQMRAFVAVVDSGSFVRAADALRLSKTAVSRLVGDLEGRVGTRLLHRTTRRLSLTPEGEVFHERCRQVLDSVAEAEAELSTRAGEAVGRLRLNVPVSFGLLHLAPLWPAFMAQHPKVVLDVTLSDRLVDLVDEGYDLAVRISRLQSSSLVSRPLATTRLMLCASPEYLRRHGTPAHPSELARHAVIAYSLLSMGEQWEFEEPHEPHDPHDPRPLQGLPPVPDSPDSPGSPAVRPVPPGRIVVTVSPRMRTNSGDTCCSAAIQHQGLVLQPSFLVAAHLASGALVEVLPQYRSIELGVYAVYPSRKHLTPKVRALIDFLVEAFRMRPWPG